MGMLKIPFSDLVAFHGTPPELAGAQTALRNLSHDKDWNFAEVNFRLQDAAKNFQASNETLKSEKFDSVFLSNRFKQAQYGRKAYDMLNRWESSSSPVLPAIVARAGDYFGFNEKQRAIVGMAAILGSCETGLSYHNASHNRKVVLQTMRLVTATPELSTDRVCELLTAACIHDLAHTGKGNMVDGKHIPFYLEDMAVGFAKPYLNAVGAENTTIENLHALIRATDVSPLGSVDAPARLVAAGGTLPVELSRLADDPLLRKGAQILQVADVASSAGLCPEQSWRESCAVARELGQEPECGKTISNFHYFMKASQPIFDALPEARQIYGKNLSAIEACIERYAVSQTPHAAQKSQPG